MIKACRGSCRDGGCYGGEGAEIRIVKVQGSKTKVAVTSACERPAEGNVKIIDHMDFSPPPFSPHVPKPAVQLG